MSLKQKYSLYTLPEFLDELEPFLQGLIQHIEEGGSTEDVKEALEYFLNITGTEKGNLL